MKKLALLLVLAMVFSYGVVFADIILPESGELPGEEEVLAESPEGEGEVTTTSGETAESAEDLTNSGEQEATPEKEESSNTVIEPEKTANPIGGIVAIIVVIVLVGLVALVSKK